MAFVRKAIFCFIFVASALVVRAGRGASSDEEGVARRRKDFPEDTINPILLNGKRHFEFGSLEAEDFDTTSYTFKNKAKTPSERQPKKYTREDSARFGLKDLDAFRRNRKDNATLRENANPNRRPGGLFQEIASKTRKEKNNQRMQNDHHDLSFATSMDDGTGKGDSDNPYNEHDHDNSKIPYGDKIRTLSKKLSEHQYVSTVNVANSFSASEVLGKLCDFEKPCAWQWDITRGASGFTVLAADEVASLNTTSKLRSPPYDADNNTKGHFLYLPVTSKTEVMAIRSPNYSDILETCKVVVWLHQYNMQNGSFKVVTEPTHGAPWVLSEIQGNSYQMWTEYVFPVGRVQQEFNIILEVVPGSLMSITSFPGAYIAIDNLKMMGCFPEMPNVEDCNSRQLKCLNNKVTICLNSSRVCDIVLDCDQGEDEMQDCDKMPFGSRCSFEDGWCGWMNAPKEPKDQRVWERNSGSTPTEKTGPEFDNTCSGRRGVPEALTLVPNLDGSAPTTPPGGCVGQYLFVNMAQHGQPSTEGFAKSAYLDSVIFNPPPKAHGNMKSRYYNSCVIRFYFHQYGKNRGSLALSVIELKDKENKTSLVSWNSKNMGNTWIRAEVFLPNVTTRYYLQFETRQGLRIYSDVAIDDFSMAPECFGINIPKQELGDYNYWDPIHSEMNTKPHKDFENKTYYELTTCGATGRYGPSPEQCNIAYKNTSTVVQVLTEEPFKGVQSWVVPSEGFYTVIIHGAGGGLGSGGVGSTRGASARALIELHKGEVLYAIVGQTGSSACTKTFSVLTEPNCKPNNTNGTYYHSKTQEVKNTVIQDGGGGGGGGTFVFFMNNEKKASPLMAAGGGGGLGPGSVNSVGLQHGRGPPPTNRRPATGDMYGPPDKTPGAGGGWLPAPGLVTPGHEEVRGEAAVQGAAGGRSCNGESKQGLGGYGGGGGGCTKGGAGGGWAGGSIVANVTHGEGGFSFVVEKNERIIADYTEILPGMHPGPGQIIIIPAIEGCDCDYRCISLDEYRATTECICPHGWYSFGINKTQCQLPDDSGLSYIYLIVFFGVLSTLLIIALMVIFFMLYNRYQVRKQAALRHKQLLEQDFQLSRLRNTVDDSALTNFNPNYGCDAVLAGGIDVRQLPQVARDSLRLVKALGQGAFGEVYQGLYRHRDGDAIEMPVAVKTLPEMSTGQSETDFLMEAAIMAKFNHPNIVHLIGVCFDRHPRFIVLELLAGGDLKIFLRENRPKPERSSSLGMKDLILCAMDVAKGCRYMESKRFIHRDIAARNCLLTSKGPGRVVKIADFGMARDIYRSDYYRKGGKARLPIKWMPPEAFMDGIFTSKTDVWSFGVLLWEVFSLGIMPYTGCANREVMQIVTSGGRLDIPHGCPVEIYRMMCDCWNPSPADRPSFSQLYERLNICLQDPELMSAPLTCFTRPTPLSRESDDPNQLQQASGMIATQASDYLVPLLPLTNAIDTEGTTVSAEPSVPIGQSSSKSDPMHPEMLDGMMPSHSSSSDHLLSSHSDYPVLPSTAAGIVYQEQALNYPVQGQTFKQLYPEYGNIILNPRGISADGSHQHNSKFQPSKSTDRLLASMESRDSIGDDEDDDGKQWETSFIEPGKNIENDDAPTVGPIVDKLISIDTPQQTPTSLQPPQNTLSYSIDAPENHTSPKSNPNHSKNVVMSTVNFIKHKPLCLDAASLEQDYKELKKNSGSVNLNNMNIVPSYMNVLTPNKLSESRKIQIDPKKAVIHDLQSPPENEAPNIVTAVKEPAIQEEPKLKTSASGSSLLNGPLTDVPYADSDNGSSSSNSGSISIIKHIKPGTRQNNYTDVTIGDGTKKKSGGFLNNDSEISC